MQNMKHITVTPADDDEVIVAGLRDDVAPQADAEPQADVTQHRAHAEREPAGAAQVAQTKPARAKPAARDEYRETTLEDLEGTPMPLAQRVVIIAAVVCIIGALVYYFTVMS